MFPAFQLQIEDEEEAFLIPEVAGEVVFHHMALMVAIIQDSEEGAPTGMFLLRRAVLSMSHIFLMVFAINFNFLYLS